MLGINEIWEKAKDYLQERLGKSAFENWVLPLKPKKKGENKLILEAPDTFFKEWVEKHYGPLIQEAINQSAKEELGVSLETGSSAQESPVCAPIRQATRPQEFKDISNLNPRYTFENFVVGPSNRHAHAYSLAVAESPAKAYNPLFIYGSVGLGKTHLMQAICQHAKNKMGNSLKVYYMTSERFTNELIDGIQHRSTPQFRQKYRNVDVLVIDDIHFIAGKESTQEEFFHTFNTLYDAHKQIIISSDRPPKEIANLQDRLVSRFGWGLTTDIQPPDLETRVAIL
ncbi:MAG: chromosomal replication initiator protein DnaA, partial [Omnitrophica WOR_2 bacterium RBG_13_44_8]